MYTPKERVELLVSMLGERLNEHGHFFRISRTRLSWRNRDVSLTLSPRGSHYSTAECTSRWLGVRVESNALRKIHKRGAPIKGGAYSGSPHSLFVDDVRDDAIPIEVELTDWWSIEESAKLLADRFDRYWETRLVHWIDHARTIEYLSLDWKSRVSLSALLMPQAPRVGTDELDALIHGLSPDRCTHWFGLLGELLLASGRDDDLRRVSRLCEIAVAAGNKSAKRDSAHLAGLLSWRESIDSM